MNFGEALELVKTGNRIYREGWNGKDQYVYFVPANSYKAQTDIAKAQFGDEVPYRAYLALKTVQNDVATWTPSVSDVLAEDWIAIMDAAKAA